MGQSGLVRTLTEAAARRIAIAAQGLARPRPEREPTTRDLKRVVDTVGLVQIDSVNVLARSQYLPLFSRLGPYDTALLDRARDKNPRLLVEAWAHEASLVPVGLRPSLVTVQGRTWMTVHRMDERLRRLSDIGDQLEAFDRVVDFEMFRPELDAAL